MTSYHDAHFVDDPRRAMVWRAVAAHLAPNVPPDSDVLELGAGYCHWINNVRAARRTAVDLWTDLPMHTAPGVEALVLDIGSGLDRFADGSFDVVLSSNLLEHFAHDAVAAVVGQVFRLLRPSGRVIIVQPNFRYAWRSYFDDYTHRSIFTDVSLPALLRSAGFRIVRVEPRFVPYSMQGMRLPVTPWLVRAYLRSPIKPAAGQMLVIAEKPAGSTPTVASAAEKGTPSHVR